MTWRVARSVSTTLEGRPLRVVESNTRPFYPKGFGGSDVLPQFEGIEVEAAAAVGPVAGVVGGLAVGGDDEAAFILDGIDGVAEVFGFAPGPIGLFAGNEKVIAAIAGMAIGGEVEGLVVRMDKGCGFVADGIDGRAEIFGYAPMSVEQAMADIEVAAAIAVGLAAGEIKIFFIG